MPRTAIAGELIGVLPISHYPVTRRWERQKLVTSVLAVCSIIAYGALTTWNVLTQGRQPVYTSELMASIPNRSNTKCQAVQLAIGSNVYGAPNGVFEWGIIGIDTGNGGGSDSVLNYFGAVMEANVTSIGFTYVWSMQTYNYGVCANATVPLLSSSSTGGAPEVLKASDGSERRATIMLCSNFDLSISTPVAWAVVPQHVIQNAFFDLGAYFQDLNFANGTFPTCNWPPYCAQGDNQPPPNNTAITPFNSYDLSAWLAGVRYLPQTTGGNYSTTDGIQMGLEHELVVWPGNDTVTNLLDAFSQTYTSGSSGVNLGITGIGNLNLLTQAQNAAAGFNEPRQITTIRSTALGVMNKLGDAAVQDLQGRVIGASYLCTITSSTWKRPWEMLAMILGNNASLFAVFLTISIALARRWEERQVRQEVTTRPEYPHNSYRRQGSSASDDEKLVVIDKFSPGSPVSPVSPMSPMSPVTPLSPMTTMALMTPTPPNGVRPLPPAPAVVRTNHPVYPEGLQELPRGDGPTHV